MGKRILLLPALLLAGLLLPGPRAAAGMGFQSQGDLHPVSSSSEPDARGGYVSWLRPRNDGGTTQGFRVWVTGLSDAADATVWMAGPGGDGTLAEVATLAASDNGSAVWEVIIDSSWASPAPVPAGASTVLGLRGGVLEIRIPGVDVDEPVLRGTIGAFRWKSIHLGPGGRVSRLRRSPDPSAVIDETASGTARVFRKRRHGVVREGLAVYAKGLNGDDFYEVWIEDAGGTLVQVGEVDSTPDGLAYFAVDTGDGDTLPAGIGVDTIRDLSRRRVEVRRSGFTGYSLAGLFPRVR